MKVMKFVPLFLVVALITFQFADWLALRSMTSESRVVSVDVRDGQVRPMVLESQDIVNEESVMMFARESLVQIFNYRPGQADEHVNSPSVRQLFINDESHKKFVDQFLSWSNHEFNVNNISIKEAVVTRGNLLMTPRASLGGARIWRYTASLPMVDRGVGKTIPSQLLVTMSMVYLGNEGGMGVYSIRLTL